MIACISQATTMGSAFEVDLEAARRAGWPAIELWLTKLETFVASHGVGEARSRILDAGLTAVAAAAQGGLIEGLSGQHGEHYTRRLALLAELKVPTLVILPDLVGEPTHAAIGQAIDALGAAADQAGRFGIRLALEPQRAAALGASLDTAAALVARVGAANLGICLDVFHYYTGPSKFEDLAHLGPENLFHVQISDISGTPRELAGDADRVLPGDGDFALVPWLAQLAGRGYAGPVSLEVLNPRLWAIPADQVAVIGLQAMDRVLAAAREAR